MSSTIFDDLATLVRSTVERTSPSVVAIGRHGRGSGFVVSPGRIVTNAHNLRDRTTSVHFADGRSAQGTLTGSDLDGDLVVLDVDTGDAPALEWADDTVDTGDVVITVAAGRRQVRAAWGQVTAAGREFRGPRGRRIGGAIEHTAPAASGSSGAPVLDRDGDVVGINTHRLEHGFYLARATSVALRKRIDTLSAGRSFGRVRLGVAFDHGGGLVVRSVAEDSPAAAAGIATGDLLVRAGPRDLATPEDLFAVLGEHPLDDELAVRFVRNGELTTVTVSFADPPAGDAAESGSA